MESSIFIIDESAGIGQEKVLLILRVEQAHRQAGRALTQRTVSVMSVKSRQSWNNAQIQEEIRATLQRIGGRVKYIIADRGANLKRPSGWADIPTSMTVPI